MSDKYCKCWNEIGIIPQKNNVFSHQYLLKLMNGKVEEIKLVHFGTIEMMYDIVLF